MLTNFIDIRLGKVKPERKTLPDAKCLTMLKTFIPDTINITFELICKR